MPAWTFADIPDQSGRFAIVTGANTGLGYETARMLAQKGAEVVLACRNPQKGEEALRRLRQAAPGAVARLEALDLSDLDSVAAFAARITAERRTLDLLINNAGVMVPPLGRTAQGFELQFGTNHLGHFALAGRLLPLLQATPGARLVVVSSVAQTGGAIDFNDLNWEKRAYSPWPAYGQSKLANMMFGLELHERLRAAGASLSVTLSHPGWTSTDLQRTSGVAKFFNPLLAMKPEDGALTTLRAATDPAAASGTYWGPTGLGGMRGSPGPAKIAKRCLDRTITSRLFDVSEQLSGVTFGLGAARKAA